MDDTTGRVKPLGVEDEANLRTREIRQEIAQTRVDMSETIEAIQEKLTPSHLVAQAGETVRHATTEKVKQMVNSAGQAADQVMDSSFGQMVKANPVPAAMIGLGAAWLFLKGRSGRARDSRPGDYNSYRTGDAPESAKRDWRVAAGSGVAVGTTGYTEYGSNAGAGSSRAPESGGDLRGYSGAGRESVSFDRVVRENPLVVGAAAALVGVAIGMSLPASEAENRLMGEARDTVVDRARELATETADKVQDVAGKAVAAATQPRDVAKPAPDAATAGRSGQGGENAAGSPSSGSTGTARSWTE